MQYKDLPQREVIEHLATVKFANPMVSLRCYKWIKAMIEHLTFVETERVKLVEWFGTEVNGCVRVHPDKMAEFTKEFTNILNLEIQDELPPFPFELSDLENCYFSKDENTWLSAKEINILIQAKEKQG